MFACSKTRPRGETIAVTERHKFSTTDGLNVVCVFARHSIPRSQDMCRFAWAEERTRPRRFLVWKLIDLKLNREIDNIIRTCSRPFPISFHQVEPLRLFDERREM